MGCKKGKLSALATLRSKDWQLWWLTLESCQIATQPLTHSAFLTGQEETIRQKSLLSLNVSTVFMRTELHHTGKAHG